MSPSRNKIRDGLIIHFYLKGYCNMKFHVIFIDNTTFAGACAGAIASYYADGCEYVYCGTRAELMEMFRNQVIDHSHLQYGEKEFLFAGMDLGSNHIQEIVDSTKEINIEKVTILDTLKPYEAYYSDQRNLLFKHVPRYFESSMAHQVLFEMVQFQTEYHSAKPVGEKVMWLLNAVQKYHRNLNLIHDENDGYTMMLYHLYKMLGSDEFIDTMREILLDDKSQIEFIFPEWFKTYYWKNYTMSALEHMIDVRDEGHWYRIGNHSILILPEPKLIHPKILAQYAHKWEIDIIGGFYPCEPEGKMKLVLYIKDPDSFSRFQYTDTLILNWVAQNDGSSRAIMAYPGVGDDQGFYVMWPNQFPTGWRSFDAIKEALNADALA